MNVETPNKGSSARKEAMHGVEALTTDEHGSTRIFSESRLMGMGIGTGQMVFKT